MIGKFKFVAIGMFLSLAFSFSAFSQKDIVSTETSDTSKTGDVPLMFCSSMPYFEECKFDTSNVIRNQCTRTKINEYISDSFIVSKKAKEDGKQGSIFISFIVNKNGEIEKIEILKGISQELDKAAIDAVKKLPKFIPAKNLQNPVSIYYLIPIKIQLN